MPNKVQVNRVELLQALESAAPALTPKDVVEQSSCFVFRRGFVTTFDDETLIRAKTPLPDDLKCAAHGRKLLEGLAKLPDDAVSVWYADGYFSVAGKRDEVHVRADPNVLLPTDKVDKPGSDWKELPGTFADALMLVAESCGKDESSFITTCVHVAPKYVEATDGFCYGRFRVKSGLSDGLVLAGAARAVAASAPSECCETAQWFHFRNARGVRVSVQAHRDEYPTEKTTAFLQIRGDPVPMPRGIVEAMSRLEDFSKEIADHNEVTVSIANRRMKIVGEGETGKAIHLAGKCDYREDVEFTVGPATLARMVKDYSEVEIAHEDTADGRVPRLVVSSGRYFFLAATGKPGKNGSAHERNGDG